jgi:hypothetical protein
MVGSLGAGGSAQATIASHDSDTTSPAYARVRVDVSFIEVLHEKFGRDWPAAVAGFAVPIEARQDDEPASPGFVLFVTSSRQW